MSVPGSTRIVDVFAWEVLDSRGRPTVACEVRLAGGFRGEASVPSGKSTGTHEARELRDGGDRYGGFGVRQAVHNASSVLADAVRGLDAGDQEAVDAALRQADGTESLERLGANAILAVSVASMVAAAEAAGQPLYRFAADAAASVAGVDAELVLPLPMVNVLSGGAHAGRALDLQDVLVVPVGAESFAQALEWCAHVRQATGELLANEGHSIVLVADEGGYGVPLPTNRQAVELLARGIERAGFELGNEAAIAIDLAASQFFDAATGRYELALEGRSLRADEWIAEVAGWLESFPIVSLEDVLAEDDWNGWKAAQSVLGSVQLLGDDLFVTDLQRLAKGIAEDVANAVLVKPNQTGTLSSARQVVELARRAGYATVLSARSGETEDAWLADLAVAWRTGQIKVGSTMRSERTAKWNRLLRIEQELGAAVSFAGPASLAGQR